jgi:demethylmenaquinone methyltransferase/2-methoxy-6-polyprenyl-1,4-benzoquinol methylase
MTEFSHDHIVPYKDSRLSKKQQVAQMFNNIAFRYDFLNRFLTAGVDIWWRKKTILQLKNIHPQRILDVATGTGDVALLTCKLLQPQRIVGIDISDGMLSLGKEKIKKVNLEDKIQLMNADSENIPFPDATFDAITVAFGVRNFEHLEIGLAEMLRVLKPGGKLAVLEFSQPKNKLFKVLCDIYNNVIVPGAGRLFAKNKEAYSYLNHSAKAFPERENFTTILHQCGYKNIYYKPLSLGICCMYFGSK